FRCRATTHPFDERLAVDQFHREIRRLVIGHHQLVQTDQVGVTQPSEDAELLLEAKEARTRGIVELFEGDTLVVASPPGGEDRPHPAFPEPSLEHVRAEPSGGRVTCVDHASPTSEIPRKRYELRKTR